MSAPRNDPSPKSDYEVGYGKPPVGSQFKTGVSGNPKGRPKVHPTILETIESALAERVYVMENGKRISVTKLELIIKQLVNKAATGDIAAIKLLSALLGTLAAAKATPSDHEPTESDEIMLAMIMKQLGGTQS